MSKTLADAIFEAEKHSKKDAKRAALSGLTGDQLRLVHEALEPMRVFNVTANKTEKPAAYANADDSLTPFFTLLDMLHDRTLSGNAAKAAVTATLGRYTERTATALLRVLDKDLKCGATISTFGEVYPELASVSQFDLMGAEKMDKKKYKWQWPCIGESKYDGLRAICYIKNGKISYFSRNGKPHAHLVGIFDDELIALAKILGNNGNIVLDGEALASSFQESLKARGSDNAEAKAALSFYAFDWMTTDEWDARNCPMTQDMRSATLDAAIKSTPFKQIKKSKFRILHNMTEAQEFYTEVLKEGLKDDGTQNGLGEGLIIKYMKAFYAWNLGGSRGPEWTKWKPIIDVDLEIVGFELGDAGSKNADKLGKLKVFGKDENGNVIRSNVGGFKVSHPKMLPLLQALAAKTGANLFNPKKPDFVKNKDQFLRAYIWDNQAEFLGKIAMMEAQELTLADGATEYSLRFPQFVMIRDDK
jgi:DNA ligase 1